MKVRKEFLQMSFENDLNNYYETRSLRMHRNFYQGFSTSKYQPHLEDFELEAELDFPNEENDVALENEYRQIQKRKLSQTRNLEWMRKRKVRGSVASEALSRADFYLEKLRLENRSLDEILEGNLHKKLTAAEESEEESGGSSGSEDSEDDSSGSEDSVSAGSVRDSVEALDREILEMTNKKKNLARRKRKTRKSGKPSIRNKDVM